MARPSKPLEVIKSEGKSHRTKAELKAREKNEKAVVTGMSMQEAPETQRNSIAHEKFERVCELLARINKLDAIYESVINRYCLVYAETSQMQDERAMLFEVIVETKEAFEKEKAVLDDKSRAAVTIEFVNSVTKLMASVNKLDEALAKKRRMLLDIEKENVMTVAAALRSIPKTAEIEKSGPNLKEILGR